MINNQATLGTQLRHLIELLDEAVEGSYREAGLDYRPRYTPVMRALVALHEGSIRAIAMHTGLTHSAISQTVAQMTQDKLVILRPGADARERVVALTPTALGMLPALEGHWSATQAAARELDKELSASLSSILAEALAALAVKPFSERIKRAKKTIEARKPTRTSKTPSPRRKS